MQKQPLNNPEKLTHQIPEQLNTGHPEQQLPANPEEQSSGHPEQLTPNTLKNYITEILDCNAFEIHTDSAGAYIPYMMNDAVECYLFFPNAHLTGNLLPEFEGTTTAEFIQDTVKSAIIFRQTADHLQDDTLSDNASLNRTQSAGAQQDYKSSEHMSDGSISSDTSDNTHSIRNPFSDSGKADRQYVSTVAPTNTVTLWYTESFRILQCYRYDQIGHFWTEGEEHWRRLVYIIGTIYDKYEYMGAQFCNEKETALLPLMEFAPFRMYSPVSESLDAYYKDSPEGIDCMRNLAEQVKDHSFVRLLNIYRWFQPSFMKRLVCHALNHPSRIDLYQLIFKKVEEASCVYPERNIQIQNAREDLTKKLRKEGYTGEYPLFQKGNHQILAMEEHPFTIMESKDFSFRIQLMESETSDGDTRINAGFFHKSGNKRRIVRD